MHLFFRAPDFLKRVGKAEGTFFLAIDRGGLWANIRVVDPVNAMWRLMMIDSDGRQTPESIDKDALIRRAVGQPFDVEWVGCSIWTRRSLVAAQYSKGRVFLAGDAVHQLSPTGAMGMNTGIGDVADLGWKLAAVAQGWGGSNLLASYSVERQPVGLRAIDNTSGFHLSHGKFHDGFAAIEDDTDEGRALRAELGPQLVREVGRMFRTIGLQLGYRYEDSPIVVPDGTPPVPDDPENFVASARPGARAPHAVLKDGSSTLDLYGRGYRAGALRRGRAGWCGDRRGCEEAQRAAAHRHHRRCRGCRHLRAAAGAGAARRSCRVARPHTARRSARHDRPGARGVARRRGLFSELTISSTAACRSARCRAANSSTVNACRPQQVERAVHAPAVEDRHRDGGQPVVVGRTPVVAAEKSGLAGAVAALAGLGEDALQPFRIARQSILRLVRFAQRQRGSVCRSLSGQNAR